MDHVQLQLPHRRIIHPPAGEITGIGLLRTRLCVRKSAIVQISDSPRLLLEDYTRLVLVPSSPEAISPATLCGVFFTAIAHQIAEAVPEWYDAIGEVVCTTSLILWLRKLVVESVRLLAILGVTDRSLLKGYFSSWLVVEFDLSSRVYGDSFLCALLN
jgi:hypothetical protein